MEMTNVCVLVVGGGPGGSSAAIALARAGVDCMLIEKFKLPHEKICGGLYSQKTHHALKELLTEEEYQQFLSAAQCNESRHIEFYQGAKLLVTLEDEYKMTLVDRALQDQWLFRHAERLGAKVKDGDGLHTIDFEHRIATLQSGQQIHYQFLIAGDGASSRTEHLLCAHDPSFPRKGKNVAAVALTIPRNELPNVDGDKLRIYFDIVPSGYSALFAMGEKVRIGIAKHQYEQISLRPALYNFANMLGIQHPEAYPMQGAMVPYGNFMRRPIWHNHLFFIGDAAGFVEMMSAEGICYAISSGTDAARSIIAALQDKSNATPSDTEAAAAKAYQKCAKTYIKMVKDSRLYGYLFDNQAFKRGFYHRAPRQSRWLSYFYTRKIEEGSKYSYLRLRWNFHFSKKKRG